MSKDAKVEKFRTVAAGLVAAIQANSTYVLRARSSLECSPKETAALASFLSSDAEHQQVWLSYFTQGNLAPSLPSPRISTLRCSLCFTSWLVLD